MTWYAIVLTFLCGGIVGTLLTLGLGTILTFSYLGEGYATEEMLADWRKAMNKRAARKGTA